MYDASQHPDVKARRKTAQQVLTEFLEAFEKDGDVDGVVTLQEFINYYNTLGASIDDDDYFELMVRNAWHISGGQGSAANTANRRVLVTRADGSQSVNEIEDDLGLKADDTAGMKARLRKQGIDASDIATYGGVDTRSKKPLQALHAKGRSLNNFSLQATGSKMTSVDKLSAFATSGDQLLPPDRSSSIKLASPMKLDHGNKNPGATEGVNFLISKLKAGLKKRGANGFLGLQRTFRIIDDDGSKSLSLGEFIKAMKETKVELTEPEIRTLFQNFDRDNNGSIDFEEFIQGVCDPMNERRRRLVELAFSKIDKDGSGVVDAQEIALMYDASQHPDVKARRKTAQQVLTEFLEAFEKDGDVDGVVTLHEFINYYNTLGASIDDDDYFELMVRNAWHISGGQGSATNTANRRVLVTRADGSQSVNEIEDDLGLKADDTAGMKARLRKQGIDASNIATYGGVDTRTKSNLQSSYLDRTKSRVSKRQEDTTPPKFSNTVDDSNVKDLVTKVRTKLLSTKSSNGNEMTATKALVNLQREFLNADLDHSSYLSLGEFKVALKNCGVMLSDNDIERLFKYVGNVDCL
jgi:Ca2+-binding EF-hand superfamily protein